MSTKTVVFYTPKEIKELKQLKRDYPTARKRTKALTEWAAKNNRSFTSARNKLLTLVARKQYVHRVKTPRVTAPITQLMSSNGTSVLSTSGELTIKIKAVHINGDEMKVTW